MSESSRRHLVIGGGLAGITAALALADEGLKVTLIEASGRLGGRVGSVTDPNSGMVLDNCQHAAFRVYGRFLQFIDRIDAKESLKIQPRTHLPFIEPGSGRIAILRTGRLSPPNHMMESMLAFPFLTLGDKLGMRRVIKSLNKMTESERIALDGVKFTDWLNQQRQSDAAISRFWGYFTLAALNLTAAEASTCQAAFLFKEGLFGAKDAFDVACFTKDLTASIGPPSSRALSKAGVDVRLNTAARGLLFESDKCIGVGTKSGEIIADSIILATPHRAAQRLLAAVDVGPDSTSIVARMLARLGTKSLIGLHALHKTPVTPEGFTFAAVLDEPIIQMVFNRDAELDESERIKDRQWISIPVSGADEWLGWTDEQFLSEYMRVLGGLWPDTTKPETFHVIKSRRATFAPTPGQHANRPETTAVGHGLYLAGSYVATDWPSTMESAVRSGMMAAEAIITAKKDGVGVSERFEDWTNRADWPGWPRAPSRGDMRWREWLAPE
jgi:squalene-associated FAD-dependent desaturase